MTPAILQRINQAASFGPACDIKSFDVTDTARFIQIEVILCEGYPIVEQIQKVEDTAAMNISIDTTMAAIVTRVNAAAAATDS